MPKTIGNPMVWGAKAVGLTTGHVAAAAQDLASDIDAAPPRVRTLTLADLKGALRDGWNDMTVSRSDAMVLVMVYPVIGLMLIGVGFQQDLLHLIFPLLAGFALLGPVAAVGLYEISRQRENGATTDWGTAFAVIRAPSFGAILVLGLYLLAMFAVWVMLANWIYAATLGPEAPASIAALARDSLGTPEGWAMIGLGTLTGFVIALVVLAVSVVSFPLLLDRRVGLPVAVVTSVRVAWHNPVVILTWGAIIAAALVVAAIPLLLGLIVVLPVLGHATWHLYRRAVD
ncbi:MAG: DUF2189 domain-containing protein [Marinibacterium sp.]